MSVQVVALVVGSKELGIGGGMGDTVELLDVILEGRVCQESRIDRSIGHL